MMTPWKAPMAVPTARPQSKRDDPGQRTVEAEILRQELRLHHAHDHGDEAEHRADRQVDVARDDDQHHAGRHDGDPSGLDRKVPKVARCQEQAAGIDVEADPDDQQRADHAEQAGVDLGRAQEARDRPSVGIARAARCCGLRHVGHRFAVLHC